PDRLRGVTRFGPAGVALHDSALALRRQRRRARAAQRLGQTQLRIRRSRTTVAVEEEAIELLDGALRITRGEQRIRELQHASGAGRLGWWRGRGGRRFGARERRQDREDRERKQKTSHLSSPRRF